MGKNICANFPHFLLDKLAVVWYNGISGRCDCRRPAQKCRLALSAEASARREIFNLKIQSKFGCLGSHPLLPFHNAPPSSPLVISFSGNYKTIKHFRQSLGITLSFCTIIVSHFDRFVKRKFLVFQHYFIIKRNDLVNIMKISISLIDDFFL